MRLNEATLSPRGGSRCPAIPRERQQCRQPAHALAIFRPGDRVQFIAPRITGIVAQIHGLSKVNHFFFRKKLTLRLSHAFLNCVTVACRELLNLTHHRFRIDVASLRSLVTPATFDAREKIRPCIYSCVKLLT